MARGIAIADALSWPPRGLSREQAARTPPPADAAPAAEDAVAIAYAAPEASAEDVAPADAAPDNAAVDATVTDAARDGAPARPSSSGTGEPAPPATGEGVPDGAAKARMSLSSSDCCCRPSCSAWARS